MERRVGDGGPAWPARRLRWAVAGLRRCPERWRHTFNVLTLLFPWQQPDPTLDNSLAGKSEAAAGKDEKIGLIKGVLAAG